MKILLIHQYYKTPQTGGAIRSYYIAKYLVSQGHEVSVITAYNEKEYSLKKEEGILVHYLPIYYTNHLSFFSRMHAFVRYVWQARKLLKKIDKPDINYVISTPLTTGLIAIYAKRKYGIPYIFEVGDLWPEAPIQLGVLKNSILKNLARKLEKRIYKQAREIIGLSPDIAKNIEKKTGKKAHVITNFADTTFFTPSDPRSDEFIIGYVGTIGLANHLEYLLQVAEVSATNPKIKFVIMGSGAQLEKIKKEARHKKLTNIEFVNPGDKQAAKNVIEQLSAMFISFKNVPVLATGSPNKFFDALAAGKLTIINFEGWIKELVEAHACGFYYPPDKPEEFLIKLQPYLDELHKLKNAQNNARALAEQFTLNKQLPTLLEVIKHV